MSMDGRWTASRGEGTTRGRGRAAPFALACAAALLLAACAAPRGPRVSPHDFLTDVSDDGSLREGVLDEAPDVRALALRALGRLPRDEQALPVVLELAAGERDPDVLVELAFVLGRWKAAEGQGALEKLVDDPRPTVRAAALDALGRLQDDRETARITSALGDGSPEVRGAAALALFRLDGARDDHPRQAAEADLGARDAALARRLRVDDDAGVRWRAACALAGVRPRVGQAAVLQTALTDDEPLVRLFALRGLAHLQEAGLVDGLSAAVAHLDEDDERLVVEATRILVAAGWAERLVELARIHPGHHVRRVAVEGLATLARKGREAGTPPPPWREEASAALEDVAGADPSPTVRREALAAQVALARPSDAPSTAVARRGGEALAALASSAEPRDRERAARLLANGDAVDEDLLLDLLGDPAPVVRAAALEALSGPRRLTMGEQLVAALGDSDVAVVGTAASTLAPAIAEARAAPELVQAAADALDELSGPEMAEARVDLADALGLPPPEPEVAPPPPGRLLDRLRAEQAAAARDPTPVVRMRTQKGDLWMRLDRVAAPRHVANFLELAEEGFYDGLDFHRVVPDFVVQGLDPRGDGWGTGGRRVPDEFCPAPFLTGSVGMPRTAAPHTGGCQVFITHLPTPHLDGDYTLFGQVIDGLDVLQALDVGDVVLSVRQVEEEDVPAEVGTGARTVPGSPPSPGAPS
jgi:cyclophilin family peptidyl-prolyl cis-trans isomerase